MSLSSFDEVFARADAARPRMGVIAAGGEDRTVLEALSHAEQRGWVEPAVSGDESRIRALAAELGISLDRFRIVPGGDDPARAAVAEIRAGRSRMLMKGQIPTPQLMRAVLNRELGLRTGRTIGQIVLMEIVRDRRVFLMTDTGITIRPTIEQRADLTQSVLDVARAVRSQTTESHWRPRIAQMAATEKPTDAMPDSVEAAELQRRGEAGQFSDAIVQGPLSFDLAYASDAGEKKGFEGSVVGAADAMIFPDLSSANLTVKAIMYTSDCRFGGLLCGTSHPVVFMSRADVVETRLRSLAFSWLAHRAAESNC